MAKIGQDAWAIAHAKWSVWIKKNFQKGAKNDSTTTLEFLCARNRVKKHLIFHKLEHF